MSKNTREGSLFAKWKKMSAEEIEKTKASKHYYYKHPVGVSCEIGTRDEMEDTHIAFYDNEEDGKINNVFAVFDGHGGNTASKYAEEMFVEVYEKFLKVNDPTEAARKAFNQIDEDLCLKMNANSGTTATVVYIKDEYLYVSNCGDSRAIIHTPYDTEPTTRLTIDHRPSNPSERERITRLKGRFDGNYVNNPRRGSFKIGVTRSLGDKYFKPLLTPIPDSTITMLGDEYITIVVACDGIWDVLSDEEVMEIANSGISSQEAADKIIEEAYDVGSNDNMTVIVIHLELIR